jgi:DNA-binding CsgD family transcriptional regulator/uncharacterized protein (DUF1330 family)
MLLIAENVMTNLEAYLGDFVPIAARTIHSADGQYLAAGEAKSLTDELSTRIVIVRFESKDRLQQWWNSPERQRVWKFGAKFARFNDVAVSVDVPQVRLPPPEQESDLRGKMHLLSYAETNSFFLERERKAADAAILRKFGLSRREAEVLSWVAQGKTNCEVAAILSLSVGTIKKHLEHIFQKLGVETRIAAAILALESDLHSECI